MKFKDKHFKQAFGPLFFAVLMTVPAGCSKTNRSGDYDPQHQGLLDPTPVETTDKYGTGVKLYQVNVPVYDENGERKRDQAILTRGLDSSNYVPDMSRTYVREVYINGAVSPSYVKVDRNNAIMTEKGFNGLFLVNKHVVIVHDDNITKYIGEREPIIHISAPVRKTVNMPEPVEGTLSELPAEVDTNVVQPVFTDSLPTDTLSHKKDTIRSENVVQEAIDTLERARQTVRD